LNRRIGESANRRIGEWAYVREDIPVAWELVLNGEPGTTTT